MCCRHLFAAHFCDYAALNRVLHSRPQAALAAPAVLIKLPTLGVLRSGAETLEEEALLPDEQLAKLKAKE
jgi:hypothetical protein